ncbi:hypothetical protein Q3A66_12970 [Hymenobacter sp. BT770]|uniref:hypothetical protein n=1 Tax=Hymenobacter sp. BT770 TaxID=2886942 RepID=UPI001D0FEE59|nr:hypothetical protein [Hymenobacter sp. BT770]MCC3153833.1 hypothetical protein [Hymenobacter sp. BT770]MDO3415977.1 hypothetical protein [Hymenobacter sp. BT770]
MIEVDLITKHGKKALGMEEAHEKDKGWRHRLPEILLEIGIIVFAITLSIQLHAWHEHSVERAEERKFLTGLRADLTSDLAELHNDSLSYARVLRGYRYFRTLSSQTADSDSLRNYQWTLRSETNLLPNSSRFEGLKSAGKLGIIENDELLSAILENYQESIPGLVGETRSFSQYKASTIQKYLDEHLQRSGDNFAAVMQSDQMYNYLSKDNEIMSIMQRYHGVLQGTRKLIREIEAHQAHE